MSAVYVESSTAEPFRDLVGVSYHAIPRSERAALLVADQTAHCFRSIDLKSGAGTALFTCILSTSSAFVVWITGVVQLIAGSEICGTANGSAIGSQFFAPSMIRPDPRDGSMICTDRTTVRRVSKGACLCECVAPREEGINGGEEQWWWRLRLRSHLPACFQVW